MIVFPLLLGVIVQERDDEFFTADQKKSFQSAFEFQETAYSLEPSQSVFNYTRSNPGMSHTVVAMGSVVNVKHASGGRCQINESEIPSAIEKITLGARYMAMLLKASDQVAFMIRVFKLDNCAFVKEHVRQAFQLNLTSSSFNLTDCKGDFAIGDSTELQALTGQNYFVAFGCPSATKITINIVDQSATTTAVGVVSLIRANSSTSTIFDLYAPDNVQIGDSIIFTNASITTVTPTGTFFNLKLSEISSAASSYPLNSYTLTKSKKPIPFIQAENDTIFAEVSFNTEDSTSGIKLMQFAVGSDGKITSPLKVVDNAALQDIKYIQILPDGQILVQTANVEHVQLYQDNGDEVEYSYPSSTSVYTVVKYEYIKTDEIPAFGVTASQALNYKDPKHISMLTKKSNLNRHITCFSYVAGNLTYYIMSSLDNDMLMMRGTTISSIADVKAFVLKSDNVVGTSFTANKQVDVEFTLTGKPGDGQCQYYQLVFDASDLVQLQSITQDDSGTDRICKGTVVVPNRVKKYMVKMAKSETDNLSSQLIELLILTGPMETVKNAVIQPMIIRSNMNFSIKLVLADAFGNNIVPTKQDCAQLTGGVYDVKAENQTSYDNYTGIFVKQIEFELKDNQFCVAHSEAMPHSKYLIRIYKGGSDTPLSLPEQVGQQLVFQINALPQVFKWTAGPIINVVAYALFMIFLAIGVPFGMYWLVEGRYQKTKFQPVPPRAVTGPLQPQTEMQPVSTPGVLEPNETPKYVGLGEVKIRGNPLMDAINADDFEALEPSDQQLKALMTLEPTKGVVVDSKERRILCHSMPCGEQRRALFIQLFAEATDFDKQLKLWSRLKIPHKLTIHQVLSVKKEELSAKNAIHQALKEYNFSQAVFAVCEEVAEGPVKPATLQEDVKMLAEMRPPRAHGAIETGVLLAASGITVLGPPAAFGPKYLLFGAPANEDMEQLMTMCDSK